LRHRAREEVSVSRRSLTAVCSPNDDIQRTLLSIHLAAPDGLLIDFGFPCGGLDVLLDVTPQKSWADLLPVAHELTADLLERATTPCPGTGGLLAAPSTVGSPPAGLVSSLIAQARERYDRVIIDVSPASPDLWHASLQDADQIALVIRGDVPGVVAGQRCLGWMRQIGVAERIRLVVASTAPPTAVSPDEVAASLGPIFAWLPWDPETVAYARNLGQPGRLPRSPLRTALVDTVSRWQDATVPTISDGSSRSRWQQPGQILRGLWAYRPVRRTT
jgi:Flp pilus assembly CpaE family ATPase